MKLTDHPEYQHAYRQHRQAALRCQEAVAAWRASETPILVARYDLTWTVNALRQFVFDLAALFRAYNQVMWEQFPYCQRCGGQCCVRDACEVGPFDLIALALLAETAPTLPAQLDITPRECIYLVDHRCAWPAPWRPLKCWSFYCLGGGTWPATAPLGQLYDELTAALNAAVVAQLPEPLQRYEAVTGKRLVDHLADPVAFVGVLHTALLDLFVRPFDAQFPVIDPALYPPRLLGRPEEPGQEIPLLDDTLLAFIAQTGEELSSLETPNEAEAPSTAQFLADLESLEWIALGRPEGGPAMLEALYQRYAATPAPVDGQAATLSYQMRGHILRLWNNWPGS